MLRRAVLSRILRPRCVLIRHSSFEHGKGKEGKEEPFIPNLSSRNTIFPQTRSWKNNVIPLLLLAMMLFLFFRIFRGGHEDQAALHQEMKNIMDFVANRKVVVYSSPSCHWCKAAIELLQNELKIEDVTEVNIMNPSFSWKQKSALLNITRISTVPQIFVNGEFIGGYSDLKAIYDSGQLHEKLGITRSDKGNERQEGKFQRRIERRILPPRASEQDVGYVSGNMLPVSYPRNEINLMDELRK